MVCDNCLAAEQRIGEINQKRNERAARAQSPVDVLGAMHTSGRISDDAVRKLDATPRSKPMAVAPEFAPLYETLTAANAAVVGISDPTIRAVVALKFSFKPVCPSIGQKSVLSRSIRKGLPLWPSLACASIHC